MESPIRMRPEFGLLVFDLSDGASTQADANMIETAIAKATKRKDLVLFLDMVVRVPREVNCSAQS